MKKKSLLLLSLVLVTSAMYAAGNVSALRSAVDGYKQNALIVLGVIDALVITIGGSFLGYGYMVGGGQEMNKKLMNFIIGVAILLSITGIVALVV